MSNETVPHPDLDWKHPANAFPKVLDAEQGLVVTDPKRSKVAIIGFANSTRGMAPYDDPEYEIWGLNQIYRWIPREDRHFEIHANFLDAVAEGTDHMEWLKKCPIPVYMTQHHAEIQNSVAYPVEKLAAEYGDYFTSTIAYEIALAIHEGFTTIALYGIDLIVGEEYDYQKACAEYYLGIAMGKGCTVIIPQASALLKSTYRYGFQREPDFGPLKLSVLKSRLNELMEERHKLLTQIHGVEGAIMEAKRWHEFLEVHMRAGSVRT